MAKLVVPKKVQCRFIQAAVLLSMLDPVRGEASTQSLDEDPAKAEPTREQFLKRKFLDAFALICAVRKEGDSVSAACMEEGEPQGTIVRVASNAGVSKGTLEMLRAIIDNLNIVASGGPPPKPLKLFDFNFYQSRTESKEKPTFCSALFDWIIKGLNNFCLTFGIAKRTPRYASVESNLE